MELLHQLGELFLQAVPTVIILFLFYLFLRANFFRPLERVLAERSARTEGARRAAETSQAAAQEKLRAYHDASKKARTAIYTEQETARRSQRPHRGRPASRGDESGRGAGKAPRLPRRIEEGAHRDLYRAGNRSPEPARGTRRAAPRHPQPLERRGASGQGKDLCRGGHGARRTREVEPGAGRRDCAGHPGAAAARPASAEIF